MVGSSSRVLVKNQEAEAMPEKRGIRDKSVEEEIEEALVLQIREMESVLNVWQFSFPPSKVFRTLYKYIWPEEQSFSCWARECCSPPWGAERGSYWSRLR